SRLSSVDCETFKHSMRCFASTICVVTTGGSQPRGMTATSVCGLSAEPALLLAGLNNAGRTNRAIVANGSFAVNVLSSAQEHLARLFASDTPSVSSKETFLARKAIAGITGCPLIGGACESIECLVEEVLDRGSHSIFVGRVVSIASGRNGPLLYHDGRYGI